MKLPGHGWGAYRQIMGSGASGLDFTFLRDSLNADFLPFMVGATA